jgi:hypothetical protein
MGGYGMVARAVLSLFLSLYDRQTCCETSKTPKESVGFAETYVAVIKVNPFADKLWTGRFAELAFLQVEPHT